VDGAFQARGREGRNGAPGIQCHKYGPRSRLGVNEIRLLQTSYSTPLLSRAYNDRGEVLSAIFHQVCLGDVVDTTRLMGERKRCY
jgi:hypothetical protein